MDEENTKVENSNNQKESKNDENPKKDGFFKNVWMSITKIEKYPDMAARGVGKAISYLAKIVAILTIILCLGMLYQTHNLLKQGIDYLQNNFPDFSYKDGILDVSSDKDVQISAEDSVIGEVIVDTKTEDEAQINQYTTQVENAGGGIIVLRDRVIIKNASVAGIVSYQYKDTLESMGITELNKQDVINYANSSSIISLYVSVFITMFVYAFIIYFITTLSNAILLSFFGFITTWLARIKMRYVAIFNMSVYALTLSVILNMLYIAVNIFIPFTMEYFQVMYVAVAAIYLVAAIMILKTDFMKKQIELMKIAEAQEMVKKELEERERKQKEEKEREDRRRKDKEEEEKKKKEQGQEENGTGGEPQGV